MVVQCDQCNTRFRLDDAKVRENGVKVRCSKCKHVFIVRKETAAEEADFDTLLSGLGGGAPTAAALQPVEPPLPSFGAAGQAAAEEAQAGRQAESAEAETGVDFGVEEPSAGQEESFTFGEEPFGEPTAEGFPPVGSGAADEFEFGEVNFGDVPAAGGFEPEAPSGGGEFEPFAPPQPEEQAVAAAEEEGFGVEAEPVAAPSETAVSIELPEEREEPVDFGTLAISPSDEPPRGAASEGEEFAASFEMPGVEEISPGEEGTEHLAAVGFDFGDITPAGGEEPLSAEPSMEESLELSFAPETEALPGAAETEKAAGEMEPLDFGDFDFGGGAAKETPAGTQVAWDLGGAPSEPAVQPSEASVVPPMAVPEEELPPLGITSRRKGSSIIPIALIAIAILLVVALGGAGFYFLKEGPSAFNKLGLGFLAKWTGMESVEEGSISIRSSAATFVVNKEAGEIFVISGEAVNNYKKPRASIQVKATLFGAKGEVVQQKSAYCGNALTREQLETMPMEKIEAAMLNQFGDSLVNLGVPSGKAIPFVIVFSKVPKEAGEFGVEVAGSTVASQ